MTTPAMQQMYDKFTDMLPVATKKRFGPPIVGSILEGKDGIFIAFYPPCTHVMESGMAIEGCQFRLWDTRNTFGVNHITSGIFGFSMATKQAVLCGLTEEGVTPKELLYYEKTKVIQELFSAICKFQVELIKRNNK